MHPLILDYLTPAQTAAAVALDQTCLGGIWSQNQYLQEISHPMSTVLACYAPGWDRDLALMPLLGLGCSWGIAEETHITLLAVAPSQQRQGLGALLVWALLNLGLAQNHPWATLEVAADNQAALKLYQKFGFQEAGRRPKYYPSGADAVILWRKGPGLGLDFSQVQAQLGASGWELQLAPGLVSLLNPAA